MRLAATKHLCNDQATLNTRLSHPQSCPPRLRGVVPSRQHSRELQTSRRNSRQCDPLAPYSILLGSSIFLPCGSPRLVDLPALWYSPDSRAPCVVALHGFTSFLPCNAPRVFELPDLSTFLPCGTAPDSRASCVVMLHGFSSFLTSRATRLLELPSFLCSTIRQLSAGFSCSVRVR